MSSGKITVVIFADDQEQWHTGIERTQEEQLSKLTRVLSNCSIVSAINTKQLFEFIGLYTADPRVEYVVVFLDLQFPTIQDGLAAQNRIKRNKDSRVRQIPVFVYSISNDPGEVSAVYSRSGSGFFHKLNHPETFWDALSHLDQATAHYIPKRHHDGSVRPAPQHDLSVECAID